MNSRLLPSAFGLVAIAGVCVYSPASAQDQEPNWGPIRTRIGPSVLYIETKTGENVPVLRGTGFVISKTGYIMTAAHVITNYDQSSLKIRSYDPEAMRLSITVKQSEAQVGIPAIVVKHDSELDVAILKLSQSVPWSWEPLCVIDSEATEEEDWLYTLGYPALSRKGNDPKSPAYSSATGRLTARRGYFAKWRTDIHIASGNSGGPVVNVDGNVVAICASAIPSEPAASFVIPTSLAKDFLGGLPLTVANQCGSSAEGRSAEPSFDCAMHYLPSERAICDDHQLALLDRTMAAGYAQARSRLGVSEVDQLRQEQRDWIKERNRCESNVACLRSEYEQRIAVLGAAIAGTRRVSPSFNCATHVLPAERAVCTNSRLAQLDLVMDRLYKSARVNLTGDRSVALRQEQLTWLGSRNQCGGEVKCIGERYQRRIGQLEAVAETQHEGPSFDCQSATAPAEIAICNNRLLASLDRRMANTYFALFAKTDGGRQAALRADQRQWLRIRTNCGANTNCLQAQYEERIEHLDRASY
jgi:uncharacterized protein/V8-like Glu-specific endopeptidase